eukprot:m.16460 g.16460  ORF g.16460 m.16460 type:complete len:72 (+) comp7079_c0_seq1:1407-1622(+)
MPASTLLGWMVRCKLFKLTPLKQDKAKESNSFNACIIAATLCQATQIHMTQGLCIDGAMHTILHTMTQAGY